MKVTLDPSALRWEMREAGLGCDEFVAILHRREQHVAKRTVTNWRSTGGPTTARSALSIMVLELAKRRGVSPQEMRERLKIREVGSE
jgi:hypothetical protein